jgi:DNA-binding beta-propeller fold protein YncE
LACLNSFADFPFRRWGADLFAMPHGLTIDDHDNVWVTDVALQQVYKFSADGRLLLTLGERGVAGADARHFNRPTAVAVAADGSFYVSDGYNNTWVMKFSADGKFLFQWGTKGAGLGQFDLPHWVALDASGIVYVADRENQRIQVFDFAGHYLTQWAGKQLGRQYAITIDKRGSACIADGGGQPDGPPDRSAWVLSRLDGTPLVRVGRSVTTTDSLKWRIRSRLMKRAPSTSAILRAPDYKVCSIWRRSRSIRSRALAQRF